MKQYSNFVAPTLPDDMQSKWNLIYVFVYSPATILELLKGAGSGDTEIGPL